MKIPGQLSAEINTKELGTENLAAAIGQMSFSEFVLQVLAGANVLNYSGLAGLSNRPMSSWLPEGLFPELLPAIVNPILLAIWASATLFALALLARFIWRERARALGEPRAWLATAIIACVVVWGISQLNRNVYEAAHVLPMLTLFVVIALSLPGESPRWSGWILKRIAPVAGMTALLSQIALLAFTARPLIEAAQTPGFLAQQEFSVSLTSYDQVRGDILRAMADAGIDPGKPQSRLLVDDVTYLALQQHRLPFHRLGVFDAWNASITDPARYLVERGSGGVVAACRRLPDQLQLSASSSGEICALSGDTLRQLLVPTTSIWDEKL